jgi:hypothetical protein
MDSHDVQTRVKGLLTVAVTLLSVPPLTLYPLLLLSTLSLQPLNECVCFDLPILRVNLIPTSAPSLLTLALAQVATMF